MEGEGPRSRRMQAGQQLACSFYLDAESSCGTKAEAPPRAKQAHGTPWGALEELRRSKAPGATNQAGEPLSASTIFQYDGWREDAAARHVPAPLRTAVLFSHGGGHKGPDLPRRRACDVILSCRSMCLLFWHARFWKVHL